MECAVREGSRWPLTDRRAASEAPRDPARRYRERPVHSTGLEEEVRIAPRRAAALGFVDGARVVVIFPLTLLNAGAMQMPDGLV